jgi:hypothetical protein
MTAPDEALRLLASSLRDDQTLLSERVREPEAEPVLGLLVAAGPRAEGAEADYAFVVEAVREGYLLHYGEPRVLGDVDPDLALLAGDHLYAVGLECLAGLGDLDAVRELGDLISLSAHVHADGPADEAVTKALWLAATTAVAGGASQAHEAAKAALRDPATGAGAAAALASAGRKAATAGGFEAAWESAADSIDLDPLARG